MNIFTRFMNWARGWSSKPEHVEVPDTTSAEIVPDVPDFDNLTKKEIVEWVEEKYGQKMSLRRKKADLVDAADALIDETTAVA